MGTYKYNEWGNVQQKVLSSVFHRKDKEEVGEVNKNTSRIPERSTELDPCWTQGRIEVRQGVPAQHNQPGKLFLILTWKPLGGPCIEDIQSCNQWSQCYRGHQRPRWRCWAGRGWSWQSPELTFLLQHSDRRQGGKPSSSGSLLFPQGPAYSMQGDISCDFGDAKILKAALIWCKYRIPKI